MKRKKRVIILGATGSIGTTALKALRPYKDQFEIVALSAHSQITPLIKEATYYQCTTVAVTSQSLEMEQESQFLPSTQFYYHKSGLLEMIRSIDADIVLNAISGAEGLEPTIVAIESGKDIALSNKESVVMGGDFLFEMARKHNVSLIPVDSEHSTLYALINGFGKEQVHSLVLTASGGPFRDASIEEMEQVTVEMALNHPTWSMGPKITVDSSTLANKGLEVIEASFLFGFDADDIEVVIHPQSVVHSLIRLHNGALYAQLSPPDMALPIVSALAQQEISIRDVVRPLDFSDLNLSFSLPDTYRFPLLALAYECVRKKGGYPIVYNAANEVAVEAFFQKRISFLSISDIVKHTLEHGWSQKASSLEEILAIDQRSREVASTCIQKRGKS
ncbi:MAG: 1-deoxy-D-xylulose-5-phosphate reductoisomerase [Sphaerochaetaceae bacterium]|jgi:1-deoxy-D-xylulose-5-phosphate reductoisomerase